MGEKRLEQALAERPELSVERRWRPFQLRPEMLADGSPWREFAVDKFGGEDRMRAAFSHVSAAGEPDGIRFDFDRVASAPNTVDAHRLILHAGKYDCQWPVADALFRSYFAEGANLNDHGELADIAAKSGLDAGEVRVLLESEDVVDEVWASQREAARLGVGSVPFYFFDGRYGLSGAQPAGVFLRALDAARSEYAV